ncbi:hypothetical protein DRN98_06205 [Methanosarcinales archaeon]|nr:MAG: hypothetical protein DRN98_06205 [Methanosarcinales archaeon]
MKNLFKDGGKNTKKGLVFAITLLLLVLSTVMILRLSQAKPLFPAGEAYYNLRIAETLKHNFFLTTDPVQGTLYELNPYHYLLATLLLLLPSPLISVFLPLVLGVISALLFFRLLRLIRVKPSQATASLLVLAVTPAFIAVFTGLYVAGFAILISLLILVIALHKKHPSFPLLTCISLTLLFTILALTSLTSFLLTFLLLLALHTLCGCKRKSLVIWVPFLITSLVIVLLSFFTHYTPILDGFNHFAFQNILSLLQARFGFDIFLVVLFLIGFIIVWLREEEKKPYHLGVLGLFILALFNINARILASFIITVYCVVAITYLYNRKWHLTMIRTGTLLLVLCSLVFSVTNQITLLVNAQPDKEMAKALIFLKHLDKGKVFTIKENGFLVEFYADKSVLLDTNSFRRRNYSELLRDAASLFMTARLREAEPILKKYDLHYILITPEMKEELWENREQGLWFLMKHSESFIKKYEEAGVEIWQYIHNRNTSLSKEV